MEKKYHPSIRDLINLPFISEATTAPNGCKVAYILRIPNWAEDCYESRCFVYDLVKKRHYQITHTGTVSNLQWLEHQSLALLKSSFKTKEDNQDKPQIWVFEELIGEGIQVTSHPSGVQKFQPFAKGLIYLAQDTKRAEKKERTQKFGTFIHVEQEESTLALYYIDLGRVKNYQAELLSLDQENFNERIPPILDLTINLDRNLKITDFVPSPLHDAIYLNCQLKDDLIFLEETSTYRMQIDTDLALENYLREHKIKMTGNISFQQKSLEEIRSSTAKEKHELASWIRIALPKGATIIDVSPDGSKLLVDYKERDTQHNTQNDIWILNIEHIKGHLDNENIIKENLFCITRNIDQSILQSSWTNQGIYVHFFEGNNATIARINEAGKVEVLDLQENKPIQGMHMSREGHICFISGNELKIPEVVLATYTKKGLNLKTITNLGEIANNWDLGTLETVRWMSKDGYEIEGVLRKPSNFDPTKKYPLVVIVHGGPHLTSQSVLLNGQDRFYYPSVQFVNKDMLLLKPNYRGSIGRGQKFLELNKENLGIGELWDVESGVDFLIAQGFVDKTKVGCMGWSYGGYISAFAATHSSKFAAISVGAGISSWYTYYMTADIPQFAPHYLSALPYENPEIYQKTSSMNKIKEAKTPTLIQQGAKDQIVPMANAMELHRGLKDNGIRVEFFLFPQMPHPIIKPRQSYTVMSQNLTWFSHFLLGEELDFFKGEK